MNYSLKLKPRTSGQSTMAYQYACFRPRRPRTSFRLRNPTKPLPRGTGRRSNTIRRTGNTSRRSPRNSKKRAKRPAKKRCGCISARCSLKSRLCCPPSRFSPNEVSCTGRRCSPAPSAWFWAAWRCLYRRERQATRSPAPPATYSFSAGFASPFLWSACIW